MFFCARPIFLFSYFEFLGPNPKIVSLEVSCPWESPMKNCFSDSDKTLSYPTDKIAIYLLKISIKLYLFYRIVSCYIHFRMVDATDLLFQVVYQEQECFVQLSKWDTVRDLKKEIFKKLGVAPHKQLIECWHKTPETDTNTLITCCLPNQCNLLVVYNVEDNFDDSDLPPHESSYDKSIPVLEETEVSSVLSFDQYFSSNFDKTGVRFHVCCLEDAFNRAFLTVPKRRQILLLYLHNKDDVFGKTFCVQLTKPNIQSILKDNFFLLCWDIEKDDYGTILIKTLQEHSELRNYGHFIDFKISSALLLAPIGNSFMVLNVLRGNVSPKDILDALTNAKEFLITENETEEKLGDRENQRNAFGSKEYQQLMLDMLGDRDYDSFDYYELEYLKEKIAYALYGKPQKVSGYKDGENEKIKFLYDTIVKESNVISKWRDRVIISFIYVCTEPLPKEKNKRAQEDPDYNPYSDLAPVPLFVLRKCKSCENPCRIFIDDTGRVYQSWQDYLSENKLPECEMIFPKNARYEADENGNVKLERRLSPACDISNSILQGADIASAVGGIASGGIMVAAASIPAVAAAPFLVPAAGIAGIAIGVYSLTRSALVLHDRSRHNESVSFFQSREARGAYINIVAGSLGFVGAGANMAVSKLAAEGFNIGSGATTAVNTLNIVNIGAGGAGVVNASYDVIKTWWIENETPSLLTIVQLSSSILFFGHAVYNYRSVTTKIEESQANTLRDYQDSLRSNRHRKAFTKLLKETIRQNEGNTQQGRAEVISTIRNIQNKDEVFAALTRSNKAMNKNGVRFAADNGKITLNGVAVDMTQFSGMEKSEVITFLTQLPNVPKPTTADVRNMTSYIESSFKGINPAEIANLAFGLAKMFVSTDAAIKEKIINAVAQFIRTLIGDHCDYMDALDKIFPQHDKYFRLVGMVNSFLQNMVNVVEEQYAKWKQTQAPEDEKPYFFGLSENAIRRTEEIFNIVIRTYYTGTHLTEIGLEKLLDYFYTWFSRQVYLFKEREERRNRRTEHSRRHATKVSCSKCGGYHYSSHQ